jgi:hypothetical protein
MRRGLVIGEGGRIVNETGGEVPITSFLILIATLSLTGCGQGEMAPPGDPHAASSSAFVDPEPPSGWVQCAGFKSTSRDDVQSNFLDGCLNTNRLRMRVWYDFGAEEDFFLTLNTALTSWSNGYLDEPGTTVKNTFWGEPVFYTSTSGQNGCGVQIGPEESLVIHGAACEGPVIIAGATGIDEFRFGHPMGVHLFGTVGFYR